MLVLAELKIFHSPFSWQTSVNFDEKELLVNLKLLCCMLTPIAGGIVSAGVFFNESVNRLLEMKIS